jgi:hypothetical protein
MSKLSQNWGKKKGKKKGCFNVAKYYYYYYYYYVLLLFASSLALSLSLFHFCCCCCGGVGASFPSTFYIKATKTTHTSKLQAKL